MRVLPLQKRPLPSDRSGRPLLPWPPRPRKHQALRTLPRALPILLLSLLAPAALSAQLFNDQLSTAERTDLESGKIVIRYINDISKSCLNKDASPSFEKVRAMMENLQPNYLCEVLYEVPYEGNENFVEQVKDIFNDSQHYLRIIYQPEESATPAPLFSQSILDDLIPQEGGTLMKMRFQMDPFTLYHADMVLESDEESFCFTHTNLDTLTYLGIRVIKPNRMLAGLAITRFEDRWLVYASGGLNAWKPFFLKTVLENMFNNRMKDFSVFYINQVRVN